MSLYTVFGGKGFIGSEFVKQLIELKHEIFIPERNDQSIYNKDLGIIIYAAGYGNCKTDPYNVLEANTILLNSLLKKASFEKIVYISSTRIYVNQESTLEDCDLKICTNDERRLFNLSKILSEEICLKSKHSCLIIRPSNVYGLALNSSLFLPSIIRDAISNKSVNMYVTPSYSKDYILVDDLVSATLSLISSGVTGIINVASGNNVDAGTISDLLIEKTQCTINWLAEKNNENFAPINIEKIKKFISYNPSSVINDMGHMIDEFRKKMEKQSVI